MIRNMVRCTIAAAMTMLATLASAADGLPGDINPGIALRRQAEIRLDKETLAISPQRITVEDVFTGTSKQKQFVPLVFTLPAMHLQQDANAASIIRDLRFAVNGQTIKPTRKLAVMLGDKDIAWRIATLGWKESELIAYLRDGQAPAGKLPLPTAWFDRQGRPRFQLRETYTWDQWFTPGRALTVRHSYVPAITGEANARPSQMIRAIGAATCMDDAKQNDARALDSGKGIAWSGLRYRIAGSRGWRPGAQDFTLRVDTGGALLATCMVGGKAVGKNALQFRAGNISMDQVIDLVFVRADG
ncbi:DUF4424 family protein [Solilutibacter silvestris]|uniref:DUF4424 domain-containing protein n=1 Tax=Solilutibacter silvestris TaxID=1645665 RepID=A0A2K1PYH2_9GAMM|nr:DUF4424 family protein [Lysobacter silvestris]PNS07727.1 hypothetical protein Lysil_1903 [Lysobacter silvestris]